jgi:PAS domain S-box-containing protein
LAITQDSRIVFCNKTYAEIFGYSVEELLSFSPQEVVGLTHAEDQALVYGRYGDRLDGKQVLPRCDFRGIKKDGTVCWLEMFASLIEHNGKPAVQATFIDITERKRAETALREIEERFKLITETIDDVFWMDDIENDRTIYTSPAHERVWGYPRQSLYENPKSFYDRIHPDDRERVAATMTLMKTGQPIDHEYRIVRPDGSTRQIWDRRFPIPDGKGRVNRYVGVAQDVTARRRAEEALRESEERYRTAIEHCNDGVAIAKGTINLFVNQRYADMFGYNRPEEIVGSPASSIAHPDEIKRMEEMMLKRQRGEPVPSRYEIRGIRKDGEPIDIEISATRTIYQGAPASLAYVRDITERKIGEKERAKLQEQVRQSQKMEAIGVLAGGVAHDFNNLLSVINGYSELLLDALAQDDPKRGDLEQIKQAGQRAASLTSQLLSFSRKQILKPEVLDLNTAITNMSKMLRRLIGEDIDLVCITRPGLGLINADPGQIQQIIMNLAVNARDAMPQGGKLTIETANVDLEEDYVRGHPMMKRGPHVMLAISDSGLGMDAATQARIFEPFFTTKGKDKGTGLGLSTVYGIVKQSGGFIWVYSEPGKGTTFKVYFPRVEGEISKSAGENESELGLRRFETVLVVEDEGSVRALACRILRERGYSVLEAADGMEALRIAGEFTEEIHLVLTDVVMPGMSGKELVSQLKAVRPAIKALFVSGYTDNAIVHHGVLDSNVAFLQKPFSADGLARKVREVVNS